MIDRGSLGHCVENNSRPESSSDHVSLGLRGDVAILGHYITNPAIDSTLTIDK
jgi:hypothetical protein